MSARIIPTDVLAVQSAASDPAVSAWVSANAGSGKTHVLAQRVIRLLLDGVDPAKILCITFTKAAAANMANRVFATLAEWTALSDAALNDAVERIGSRRPDAARRARARRLFATALETPGGLKVQTIHAFCTRLLHQFPFEANVSARFTVLDEAAETQLLDRLVLTTLLDGAANPDGAVGRALSHAITVAADQTFKDVVREAIRERRKVQAWLDRVGGVDAAVAELSAHLGIGPGDTAASVAAAYLDQSEIAMSEWPALAQIFGRGTSRDGDQLERLLAARDASGAERIAAYRAMFVGGNGEPRKAILTAALAREHPGWAERLTREQERIVALLARERAVACRDRTAALLTIVAVVLRGYQDEKDRRGLLDYEDLIDRTLALFANSSAAWVLYKLDLGIDHILVDEAQDTSPLQWAIIETLVNEFAAGAGARGGLKRTLFAVGDDKQSIFSFQGAVPRRFAEMKTSFGASFKAAGLEWRDDLRFEASFRSGDAVLGAVDTVFAQPHVYAALTADPVKTVHRALPDAAPGLVEIWDLISPDPASTVEPWDAPFDTPNETSPQVRLAVRIAATVKVWLRQGRRPGDVLILVRQRGPLFEAIIRALKAADIAIAGADRLLLSEHIAIMDLMVLADALLLPQDDLALATVLRSPLFGFTEEQLFALAWNRRGSLRGALRAKAGEDAACAAASALLDRLAQQARQETPFAFYAALLGAGGARRRFLARLGPEATDALDEFLNLALDYEKRETPSLQGFMAWLRASQAEVKRDMEITRDEVRVMTVHGAKGLEAPVVILADTTTKPTGPRDPRVMPVPMARAGPGFADPFVWARGERDDVPPTAAARTAARTAAQEEYCRLLYVAMTRAAERLVICGTEGTRRRPEGCWYDLVRDALWDAAVEEPADDGDGTVRRFRKGGGTDSVAGPEVAQQEFAFAAGVPDFLMRDAVADAGEAPIAPSHALGARASSTTLVGPRAPNGEGGPDAALSRGRLVHRLLQALPDLPIERRAEAATRFLARTAEGLKPAQRDAIVAQVLAALDAPQFAALFAPGSRGEVPIVGRVTLSDGVRRRVSGQVDRLAVAPGEVLIADFKTDRPAARTMAEVPRAYLVQLALYRAVLAKLYPGHAVRTALLWTEGPDLVEVSSSDLDRALATLTSA